ncbi:MAG: EVE domain-containing protein [Candidatus Pacebacteria bacterium]|nr:EVE domain-containing protein [Candidatus Paceibacterota bacterium]
MQYWLMKSEPSCYSIDDLARDGVEPWDGVRNYQARNLMRDDMQVGDIAFFYHSNAKEIGIVGLMTIASAAYPDPTQFDKQEDHYDPKSTKENPRWLLVDVKFKQKFTDIIPLAVLKNDPAFADMALTQKGMRLSVQPVKEKHYKKIMKMVGQS